MSNRSEILKEDGVLYLKNFYSESELSKVLDESNAFIRDNNPYGVKPNINTNFDQLRGENKLVINRRIASRDGDEGLVDVWNYDMALSEDCKQTINTKANHIKDIISETFSCQYEIKTYNLYLNKGISETRGIHADSHFFPSRVKSFLFLTDVKDKSYGPFSFIKGSHLGEGLRYHKKYDIYEPLTDDEKERYTIFDNVSAGDVVIACVSGAHRGIPQQKDKERRVIVISYDPK